MERRRQRAGRYSAEFRRDAVALVRSSGRPIADIARDLGVGERNLYYWVKADRAAREGADPEAVEAEDAHSTEVAALRARVAELEEEREILKRAVVFWVQESNE